MSNMVVFATGGSLCPSVCDFHSIRSGYLCHMWFLEIVITSACDILGFHIWRFKHMR